MLEVETSRKSYFPHINPRRGIITVDKQSPVVVMKKIRLRRSDDPAPITLPELEDADEPQDLASQRVNEGASKLQEEVTIVHTMTLEEMNDHVQKCLEMNTENKINQRNAFALQLIDCMSVLLQSKKDFSTMACTLDAGAKIYSYRVDALHQQVIKLADEFVQKVKKNGRGGAENEDQDETLAGRKAANDKRRANKKNVIASRETLNRNQRRNDPKDKYIKVEALPGAIISGSRRDPKDLSYSLELSVPFWQIKNGYEPLKAEGTVNLPTVNIIRDKSLCRQCLSFSPECKHQTPVATPIDDHDNIIIETDSSQEPESIVDFPTNDPVSEQEEENEHSDQPVDYEPEINQAENDEVDVISTAMERLKKEAETNGAVNKAPSRLEAMKMLFEDVGEYDYLNMKNKNYWAGPGFWKRPRGRVGNVLEKRTINRKKRQPGEIVYHCDNVDQKWNTIFKKEFSLRKRTVQSWQSTKNTLPKDLKIKVTMFIDLFHMSTRRRQEERKTIESIKSVDEFDNSSINEVILDSLVYQNSPEVNDSSDSQDPLNDSFYQGAPGNIHSNSSEDRDPVNSTFYDVGILQRLPRQSLDQSGSGKPIRVQIASENTKRFGESSLVPLPKMVKFQPIKYSTRPIRVDMQHLKQSMLGIIENEIEKDDQNKKRQCEQIASFSLENLSPAAPETKFSHIIKTLPRRLERRTAEDVSPAIAFMALLTLANENNLQLENTENFEDVIVKLEDTATAEAKDEPSAEPKGGYVFKLNLMETMETDD